MKRKIASAVLLVLLCTVFAVPVFAARQGSVLLQKVEKPVTVFKVADEKGQPDVAFAALTEKLTADDLKPEIARKLYKHTKDKELSGKTQSPDEKKEIFFSALEEGWYLVCSAGEKAEFAPFLVCVPMTIGGNTVYDIQAEPKTDTPADPSGPANPLDPKPNIPQTGAILWPKYLLLILGGIAIGAGVFEVLRGREKRYE